MTKVREFMTGWESPDTHQMIPLVWSDRNKEGLRGVAKGKRFTPKLRPFDMLSEPNQRLKIFESADVRVIVESVTGTQNFRRNSDFDEVLIQFCGTSHVESEFGKFDLAMGEVLVIPGGVSYRSTGANDCLRMVLDLHEPVFKVFDEKDHTSETTYTMKRTNGPNWSAPSAPPSNAKVIEKLYIWDEDPEDATIIERDYSDLVGVSSIKSKENIVKKVRAFDIFNEITGKAAGPKIVESPHCLIDSYNTVGDQWAFHRALRSRGIRAAVPGHRRQHVGIRAQDPDQARRRDAGADRHRPLHRELQQGFPPPGDLLKAAAERAGLAGDAPHRVEVRDQGDRAQACRLAQGSRRDGVSLRPMLASCRGASQVGHPTCARTISVNPRRAAILRDGASRLLRTSG